MESKVNYTIVGLFVILLGIGLVAVSFWLTEARHQKSYNPYLVFMGESVSGLSEQSSVLFNGVRVGYVKTITLDPNNPQRVRLLLMISDETPINASTTATLMSQGITGLTYVGLKARAANAPPLEKVAGQPYPVIPSEPSLLMQLNEVLRHVTDNIQDMSNSLKRVFTPENTAAFSATLANVKVFTGMLAKNSDDVDASIKSARSMLANADQASERLPAAVKQLQETMASAKQMTESVGQAGKQISATMRDGRVAINEIRQQVVPNIVSATDRLDKMLADAQALAKRLKQQPSALIRPTLPPPPGPGE